MFDLAQFDEYREDNRREVKKAEGGLPNSLWETYSAFANCYGGIIVLGVRELEDGKWKTTGLKNTYQLIRDFWNSANNPKKVSINLLKDKDVKTYSVDEDTVIVINIPMAKREQKPIYINDNLWGGTFRRNGEGDYHCTRSQIKAMLRDQTEETTDMKTIDFLPLSELNQDTVKAYRNYHQNTKEGHPFTKYNDEDYLRSIGAAVISKNDKELHPTGAGLLMFGNDYDIVREYPEYFLDYQEHLDPKIRWTDRLESTSGTWSGNLFDFFFRVYNKIAIDLKVPFKMEGIRRIDDTPVHKAIREALVNCITNADYYIARGILIKKMPNEIIMENPGCIRTGKKQMLLGGVSDPRNKALMKMFSMLDFGERAGSGVPNILNIWEEQKWSDPVIEEIFDPERTRLTLLFEKKAAIKSGDKKAAIKSGDKKAAIKSGDKRITKKLSQQQEMIMQYMKEGEEYRLQQLCELLGLKESRTKDILKTLINDAQVEAIGANKDRRYRLVKDLSDATVVEIKE